MSSPSGSSPGLWQRARAQFKQSRKKTGLLVLLLPVLVAVWVPLLRGKPRSTPEPSSIPPGSPNAQAPATEVTSAAQPSPAPLGESATSSVTIAAGAMDLDAWSERVERALEPRRKRWRAEPDDDPFVAGTPAATPEQTVADIDRRLLAPSSIYLSATAPPVAIIQGRAWRPGETIEGHVIVAIEERTVVLERAGEAFALSIPEPAVGDKHE